MMENLGEWVKFKKLLAKTKLLLTYFSAKLGEFFIVVFILNNVQNNFINAEQ